jgi:hypothetical protein
MSNPRFKPRNVIPPWVERCEITRGTSDSTIQARMQSEIDDLRAALTDARNKLAFIKQCLVVGGIHRD